MTAAQVRKITPADVKSLVKQTLGLDVTVSEDEADPCIAGTLSTVPFGVIGSIMVWRDRAGNHHAIGVPFGAMLSHREAEVA